MQALSLDDDKLYDERLLVLLHRLELRSELYKQPSRPEDQAAMIIEQVILIIDHWLLIQSFIIEQVMLIIELVISIRQLDN